MSLYVADASIVAKWFFPEVHSDAARRVRSVSNEIHIPDLLFAEFGNVLWKRARAGDVTEEQASIVLTEIGAADFEVHPSWPLVLAASEIAHRTGRTVYDSLYVALAVEQGCELVTADERLFNALAGGPLGAHVLWVADVPDAG